MRRMRARSIHSLAVTLLALFFSSFGLIVSNYSNTMQQAIFVMWFFVVCLLLSGLFTPVRSMPSWAYLTTYVNPMHYFIDAVRAVFVTDKKRQHAGCPFVVCRPWPADEIIRISG